MSNFTIEFNKFFEDKPEGNIDLLDACFTVRTERLLYNRVVPSDDGQDAHLKVDPCDVFENEELTYLFYGVPAFKEKIKIKKSNAKAYPICLIFDLEKLGNALRIAPFDTGAYDRGDYDEYFSEENELMNFLFEYPQDYSIIKKMTTYFYNNNRNYYEINVQRNIDDVPASQIEISGYIDMISDTDGFPDDRRQILELQFEEDVSIKNCLVGIVMPERFERDHRFVNDLMMGLDGVEKYTYATPMKGRIKFEHYYGLLYNSLKTHFRNKGLI